MAGDSINQQMGFDVSQALEAVKSLDSAFAGLQGRFTAVAGSFQSFNSDGQATVSTLQTMAKAANSAAAAMSKLNTSGGSGAKVVGFAGAGNIPQQVQQIQTALAGVNAQAATTAQALTNTGSQGSQAMKSASSAASSFGINLETISRVLATQVIVRSFNAIKVALQEAFSGFIEFNKAAAEVQTILDQPLEKIEANLRSLSDSFNVPLLDVAKAQYQALSNGFTTAADNADILNASLKFSKVGISDAKDAVNLLSTVLNAFGSSASQADTVAAKLVKTIQQGRVIGTDLANAIGRVAPIANELGVSVDELSAGFSSITIGGVKASEAATQLRSTLAGLLKPSKDMEEAFKALGVDSGQSLIGAYGFQGALQAVIGTTDGTVAATAKLFPNIRAIGGVLRETGTGVDIFQSHLQNLRDEAAGLLDKKYELRVESNAEQVSAQLNKLKNFFTVDIGSGLVNSASKILGLVGGVDTLTSAIQAFLPVLGAAVVGLGSWGITAGISATAAKLLAVELSTVAAGATLLAGGLAFGLTAGLAVFALYNTALDRLNKSYEASVKAALDAAQKKLKVEQDNVDKISEIAQQETNIRLQFINREVAEYEKAATKELAALKDKNKAFIDETKDAMDHVIQARQKGANDIARDSQQAENDAVGAHKRAIDLQGKIDDEHFTFVNRRFSAQAQIYKEVARSQQLASKGASLGTANTSVQREAGKAAFDRAEAFARSAKSAADQTGNLSLQAKAEKNLEEIQARRVKADLQEEQTRKKAADRLAAQAAEDKKSVDRLQGFQRAFVKNTSLFDKDGNRLSDKDIAANKAKALAAVASFNKEVAKGAPLSVGDLLNFDQIKERQLQNVTPTEIKNLSVAESGIENLVSEIQKGLDSQRAIRIKLAPDPTAFNDKQTDQEQADLFREQQEKLKSDDRAQREADNARGKANLEIQSIVKNVPKDLDQPRTLGQNIGNVLLEALPRAIRNIGAATVSSGGLKGVVQSDLDRASQAGQLKGDIAGTAADIAANPNVPQTSRIAQLRAKQLEIKKDAPNTLNFDNTKIEAALTILEQADALITKNGERTKEGFNANASAGLSDTINRQANTLLNNKLNSSVGPGTGSTALSGAAAATATATDQTAEASQKVAQTSDEALVAFDAAVSATNEEAANLERAAQAAQAIQGESSSAHQNFGGLMSEYHATGGKVGKAMRSFYASGGQARGTDTVPAMLSPGEFVMNAGSTQKFYSQLVAMNAGQPPIYRAEGGPVTNVHGGINLSVQASPNPQATAREVMQMIRRETRRGSSLS